jgi:hypothetical protein
MQRPQSVSDPSICARTTPAINMVTIQTLWAVLQVEVVAEVDGWLHCVASNGAKGLIPASYMQLLPAGDSPGPYRVSSPGPSVRMLSSPAYAC